MKWPDKGLLPLEAGIGTRHTAIVTKARVLTFHVDAYELPGLTEAIDDISQQFERRSDFRGLVCLEHDGIRNEIIVITMWDGEGLESTEAESEDARHRIAATTDLGVTSKHYDVLRLIPGSAQREHAPSLVA